MDERDDGVPEMTSQDVDIYAEEDERFVFKETPTGRNFKARRSACLIENKPHPVKGSVMGQESHRGAKKARKWPEFEMEPPNDEGVEYNGDTTEYVTEDIINH